MSDQDDDVFMDSSKMGASFDTELSGNGYTIDESVIGGQEDQVGNINNDIIPIH